MGDTSHIAILGAGNIGSSIANGLAESGRFLPEHIILTRRRLHLREGKGDRQIMHMLALHYRIRVIKVE